MNDLRLSAFAPRRRFSYAVSFDGYEAATIIPVFQSVLNALRDQNATPIK